MPPIPLKSAREIAAMRRAGAVVAEAHRAVLALLRPGVTTGELNEAVAGVFRRRDVRPLFLGHPNPVPEWPPFPAVACVSLNSEIAHAPPDGRAIEPGDLVKVDTACAVDGWCADSGWTYAVGRPAPADAAAMDVGRAMLAAAVDAIPRAGRWSEVASLLGGMAADAGLGVVSEFCGHGIGREMHESPQVPNYPDPDLAGQDFDLLPGMTLAIEPMLTCGDPAVILLPDCWTLETRDFSNAVHFEHTVALHGRGGRVTAVEVLTAGVGGA